MVILAQLAPPTSSTDWNSSLVSWLILIAIAVIHAWSKVAGMRRRPSVDVDLVKLSSELSAVSASASETRRRLEALPSHHADLASLQSSLGGVHHRLACIDQRLSSGDELMASLRERQGVNAAVIDSLKADAHDTKTLVIAIAAKLNVRRSAAGQ